MPSLPSIAWLRILFAEGPRQVINAITLYTVMKANLIPEGQHAANGGKSPIAQFFLNVRILADANNQQAAILFGMLFTLIIWVFAAFGLILACLFYVIFLWHHIPSLDGTLARYCRRKVDKRLAQIVGVKIKRAIEREDRQWNGDSISNSRLKHQPTLPILDDDKFALSRQTTQSTLTRDGPQSPLDSVNPFGGEEHSLSALVRICGPSLPPSSCFSLCSVCLASQDVWEPSFRALEQCSPNVLAAPSNDCSSIGSSEIQWWLTAWSLIRRPSWIPQ